MSVRLPLPLLGFVTASALTGSVALTHSGPEHPDPLDEGGITQEGNVPYDGRFTFARIRFGVGLNTGSFGRGRGRGGLPPWAHDYPRAERNFMNILRETTLLYGRWKYIYDGRPGTDPLPDGVHIRAGVLESNGIRSRGAQGITCSKADS